jgi:hypothetical protein
MLRDPILVAAASVVLAACVQDARADSASAPARCGNVLFTMPRDWTRKDTPGATLLMPPQLPGGKWFELRLPPGEESTASPEQAIERHVGAIKARYKVQDSTPVARSTHKRGWIAASIALTVNVAPDARARPDLRFWVIYAARPTSRIEVLHYVSNDYQVYVEQSKTVEQFINGMNFANLIVLVDGAPKLTELLVFETTDFLEWLLEVPFTDQQRQTIREGILEIWNRKDQKEIDATLEIVKLRRQMAATEPTQAEFARAKVQSSFIAEMRKDPEGLSRLLVEVYDAGHRSIAAGKPPLTRQSADAMLEIVYFMSSVLEQGPTITPTHEEKDRWAAKLAEQYATIPDAQKIGISQMPLTWAALRWAWPTLADSEKNKLKVQFAQYEPVIQVRKSIAAARKADNESFAVTMQRMQRSHESFMFLSNLSHQMHNTNMAMISNMGGGGWRYEYRYR